MDQKDQISSADGELGVRVVFDSIGGSNSKLQSRAGVRVRACAGIMMTVGGRKEEGE